MCEKIRWGFVRRALLKIMGVPNFEGLSRLSEKVARMESQLSTSGKKKSKKTKNTKTVYRRVLLADTESKNYDLLRKAVPSSFELKKVKDWNEIFIEHEKAYVPLVVIDLALMGPEGVKNIQRLKLKNPKIKIVALSSYLNQNLTQAMPNGLKFSSILQKPLQARTLKEKLGKFF